MGETIGIIGKGGQADEAMSFSSKTISFQAVDSEFICNGDTETVDIANPGDFQYIPVHIAVGSPALRRDLEDRWPGKDYETIIAPQTYIDTSVEIGEGSLVAPNAVLTTNVKIGKHVLINVAATVQHNSSIGDFTTLGPGVNIGGNVNIGRGVFIGIGAKVVNSLSIEDGVVLGSGSTLIEDANTKNGVYVGTPAKLIRTNDDWLYEI